ncbi:hypothetical protein PTTG_25948 [Puccinia triticina 1-1 BBBD Race 1]|uniref:DUF4219 domain-containing protein n=1 Tax=Puccinia triticina (isolate 1-1 / race 1 (BBBD)) TaxID=630390 RepID=A0A180GZQ1_PUCT1|nr:hypothetical protein PTTG_25948 [Puccinia triticina 1-1 BBBD Race 1]
MAYDESNSSDSSIGRKPTMKVPKFTGENFEIWEKKIRMVLVEFNLENFIDLILASYEVWVRWEDTQFNDNMAAYISSIEECLAKFDSLGMIVPDFVICCSIISRITKKIRPFLMQSLFGDLNSLGKPKHVIN